MQGAAMTGGLPDRLTRGGILVVSGVCVLRGSSREHAMLRSFVEKWILKY
jgi:hypothetical protein